MAVLVSRAWAQQLGKGEPRSNINNIPDSEEAGDDDDTIVDILADLTIHKQKKLEERRRLTSQEYFESKRRRTNQARALTTGSAPTLTSNILSSISAILPDPNRKPQLDLSEGFEGDEEEEDSSSRDLEGDAPVPDDFEDKEETLPGGGPKLLEIRGLPFDNPFSFDLLSGQSSFFTLSSEEPTRVRCTTTADEGGDADLAFYQPSADDGTNPTYLCGSASQSSNETCQAVLVKGDLLVEVVGFKDTSNIQLVCTQQGVEYMLLGEEVGFQLDAQDSVYFYADVEAGTTLLCNVKEPASGTDADVDLFLYSTDQSMECSSTSIRSNEVCALNSNDYSGPIVVRLEEASGNYNGTEYHEIACYTAETQVLPLNTPIPIPWEAPLQAFQYVSKRGSVQLQCGVTASDGNGTALLMSYNTMEHNYYRHDPCKAQRNEICHLGGLYPDTTIDIQAVFDSSNFAEDTELICSEVGKRFALLSPGKVFVQELEIDEAMFLRIESEQAPVHSYCEVKVLDEGFDGKVEVVRGSLLETHGRPEIQNDFATSDVDATVANSGFWIVPNTEWVIMLENFRRETAPQPVAFRLECHDQFVRTLTPGEPSLPFALAQEPIFGGEVGFVLPVPQPSNVTCTVQTPDDQAFGGLIDLIGIDEFSAHGARTGLCFGAAHGTECTAETADPIRHVLIKITPDFMGNATQIDHVLCNVDAL